MYAKWALINSSETHLIWWPCAAHAHIRPHSTKLAIYSVKLLHIFFDAYFSFGADCCRFQTHNMQFENTAMADQNTTRVFIYLLLLLHNLKGAIASTQHPTHLHIQTAWQLGWIVTKTTANTFFRSIIPSHSQFYFFTEDNVPTYVIFLIASRICGGRKKKHTLLCALSQVYIFHCVWHSTCARNTFLFFGNIVLLSHIKHGNGLARDKRLSHRKLNYNTFCEVCRVD